MKLEFTLPELWAVVTNQYMLLGTEAARMDLSIMRQVYKGVYTLKKGGVTYGIDCSDADILHLARYTDPMFRVGSIEVGKDILFKVLDAMHAEDVPPTAVQLSEELEDLLKEALHDDYYARKGTDDSPYTATGPAA